MNWPAHSRDVSYGSSSMEFSDDDDNNNNNNK